MEKYQIRIYNNRPKELVLDKTQDALESIEEVAAKLNRIQIPWYLVGGFGIDMHYQKLTRKHHDIDIEVDIAHVPEFLERINDIGYGMFTRAFMTKIAPCRYLEIYRPSLESECIPEIKGRVRMITRHYDHPLTNYIDVKFCHQTPFGTWIGNDGKDPILVPGKYDGPKIQIGSQIINLRNIHYHKVLKSASCNTPVTYHDLATIDSAIEAQASRVM